MSMMKGFNGIFSNISCSNLAYKPESKKVGKKNKRLTIQTRITGRLLN